MNNKGEALTQNRIGFEKINIALGVLYTEWYELISQQLSNSEGMNLELGCGASFIDEIIKSIKKSDVFSMLFFSSFWDHFWVILGCFC